jgi:class 3 adenylate cyclase
MNIENDIIREAFFVFVDIRGFTDWAKDNQFEIKKLINLTYSTGVDIFGQRKEQSYLQRVVKYLGDGFFAALEYKDDESDHFISTMNQTIDNSCQFIKVFKKKVFDSNLHDKNSLGIGIGISFGSAIRFNMPGMPIDYSGKCVNISSRLCDVALDKEIVLEGDLIKYYKSNKIIVPEGFNAMEVEKEPKKMGKINVLSISLDLNRRLNGIITPAREVINTTLDIINRINNKEN